MKSRGGLLSKVNLYIASYHTIAQLALKIQVVHNHTTLFARILVLNYIIWGQKRRKKQRVRLLGSH